MAAQQGFQYEKNVAKFLKTQGLVEKTYNPAGATSESADLEMLWARNKKSAKKINVELKIEAASGGSLVLKKQRGKWGFADVSSDPEKKFLAELAESCGALKKLNKMWNDVPIKYADKNSTNKYEKMLVTQWAAAKTRADKDKLYNGELKKFPEINESLKGSVISAYYELKDTYYINVGTSGFYLLGKKDPAGINDNCRKNKIQLVPSFADVAAVKYRARVQAKGGGNFQYTFELSFTLKKADSSPYNIGPCAGGGNVNIIKGKVNLDCFL